MAALFGDWAPLEDPSQGVQQVEAWRPLLESQAARDSIFQVSLANAMPGCMNSSDQTSYMPTQK